MNKSISILSTKKLKPSIIKEASQAGLEIIDEDFITITYDVNKAVAAMLKNCKKHLVFTSQHAANGFLLNQTKFNIHLQNHKIYCLQNETLKAAENINNSEIISTAKDAISLAKKIIDDKIKAVSFICGNNRRNELPDALAEQQIDVEEIKVYESQHNPKHIKNKYEAVLFFSPSAAESFFKINILQKDIPCFCIGATTASSVKNYAEENNIIIAANSTQESILESVKTFFNIKSGGDEFRKRNASVSTGKIEK